MARKELLDSLQQVVVNTPRDEIWGSCAFTALACALPNEVLKGEPTAEEIEQFLRHAKDLPIVQDARGAIRANVVNNIGEYGELFKMMTEEEPAMQMRWIKPGSDETIGIPRDDDGQLPDGIIFSVLVKDRGTHAIGGRFNGETDEIVLSTQTSIDSEGVHGRTKKVGLEDLTPQLIESLISGSESWLMTTLSRAEEGKIKFLVD
jgi:hypothetical protein